MAFDRRDDLYEQRGGIDTPAPRRIPHLRNRSRKTSTRSAQDKVRPRC